METLLEIVVHPRKPKFGFMHPDEWSSAWHVQVVSPPLHDEANVEILKECSKFFGAPVQLVRGPKSSRKIIRISLSPEMVEKILRNKTTPIQKKDKNKTNTKNKKKDSPSREISKTKRV